MSEKVPESTSSSNDNEESLSKKAKESGLALKELANSIGRKTKDFTEQKSTELKEAARDERISAKDAADIQMLGSHIENIITIFEDTMDRIRGHSSFDEQHSMLIGFKKILEEEVNVINARLNMAKRLKGLEPAHETEGLEEKIGERKTSDLVDSDLISQPLSDEGESNTMAEMVEGEDKDKP
jgi:hypothetical protein